VNRRWLVQKTNPEYIAYLSGDASISPALAQILINRGVKSRHDVEAFLFRAGDLLSDPFELEGMTEAVEAIEGARKNSTRVLVHGDYDADGVTATAIVMEALTRLGLEAFYFVPNRFDHGYGFSEAGLEHARRAGAGLIITVDCGISSFDECRKAMASGIGVVVCDHHEPVPGPEGPVLPGALSVVNPKVSNPGLANLSGAGIALKLVQALSVAHPGAFSYREFVDLAALGTLADSVPLVGENRLIVKEGLPLLMEGDRPGTRALREVSGVNGRRLRAGHLVFTIVPRINAAGRLSDASEVVELLLCQDGQRAQEMARSLDMKNSERQKIEEKVLVEAMGTMEREGYGNAIVLAGEGWHQGVLGIVASRIAERFQRPAFVLSVKDGVARGSARSIPQFDIFDGLGRASGHLISFGGHTQAAGLKLKASELGPFRRTMDEVVARTVDDFTPTLTIDAVVSLKDIGYRFVEELSGLEPFGFGNPEPVLGSKGLEVMNPRVVGTNHLKMKLRSNSVALDAIGFDMGGLMGVVEDSLSVDAAFSATINEWEGGRTLQLSLKGLRPA
jgi:single-stranded-DNA-specific exonuclease